MGKNWLIKADRSLPFLSLLFFRYCCCCCCCCCCFAVAADRSIVVVVVVVVAAVAAAILLLLLLLLLIRVVNWSASSINPDCRFLLTDCQFDWLLLFRCCCCNQRLVLIKLSSIADADWSTAVVPAAGVVGDAAINPEFGMTWNLWQINRSINRSVIPLLLLSVSKVKRIGVPPLLRSESTTRLQHCNQFVHS